MKIEKNEIKSKINNIIADIIESNHSNFDENSQLIEDLEFDSMCFLELSVQIQREYGVIITASEWMEIKMLSELYQAIISKTNSEKQ